MDDKKEKWNTPHALRAQQSMFHINHSGELTGRSLELDAIRARLEKLRQTKFRSEKSGLGRHAGQVSISILTTRFKRCAQVVVMRVIRASAMGWYQATEL